MVKTVLHELVKLRGTAIKGHLSMVPIDTEPQPIILAYIDLNLQVNLAVLYFSSIEVAFGGCVNCSGSVIWVFGEISLIAKQEKPMVWHKPVQLPS